MKIFTLKNKYKNQNGILFGPGPSLLKYRELDLSCMTFGVNANVCFSDIDLDFCVFYDMDDFRDNEEGKKFIREYTPNEAKFHFKSKTLPVEFVGETSIELPTPTKDPRNLFQVLDCLRPYKFPDHNFRLYGSVSFLAIQLMMYLGIRNIYIVGHDISGLYWDDTERFLGHGLVERELIANWYFFIKTIRKYYPRVKLISVNPVSLVGILDEDIYT